MESNLVPCFSDKCVQCIYLREKMWLGSGSVSGDYFTTPLTSSAWYQTSPLWGSSFPNLCCYVHSCSFLIIYAQHVALIQRNLGIKVHFLLNGVISSNQKQRNILCFAFYHWRDWNIFLVMITCISNLKPFIFIPQGDNTQKFCNTLNSTCFAIDTLRYLVARTRWEAKDHS